MLSEASNIVFFAPFLAASNVLLLPKPSRAVSEMAAIIAVRGSSATNWPLCASTTKSMSKRDASRGFAFTGGADWHVLRDIHQPPLGLVGIVVVVELRCDFIERFFQTWRLFDDVHCLCWRNLGDRAHVR